MKVGDLVKYAPRYENMQDKAGLVIETAPDRFYNGRVRVLWSKAQPALTRWDWVKDLRIVK